MGRFTLRLPQTLHYELENLAQLEGVSLNQYIVYALTRQISPAYTVQVLPETAVAEQKANYHHLLRSLGNPSRTKTEAFLEERSSDSDADEVSAETAVLLKQKIKET
jgi:hypothetical protein